MSKQIVATAKQIEGALKGTGLSKEEFLKRLVKQREYQESHRRSQEPNLHMRKTPNAGL